MVYRGRHFSPSLSDDRYLKLGSKSRGTSFNTTLWYRVQRDCALCILFSHVQLVKNMQIESTEHRELLLVPVSYFAHEKGGIYNRSESIMSIDKPS